MSVKVIKNHLVTTFG